MPATKTAVQTSQTSLGYGDTLDLRVAVRNTSPRPVHVVSGRIYAWTSGPQALEILVGQPEVPPRLDYFRFAVPFLVRLAPGRRTTLQFTVGMPPRESFIGADGIYAERETPVSGSVTISVVVAYLAKRFRPVSEDPLREFVDAQKFAAPATLTLSIAPP